MLMCDLHFGVVLNSFLSVDFTSSCDGYDDGISRLSINMIPHRP
jgi:hypothetical protein